MSKLFEPLQIGPLTVPNRVAIAPMCQYSANDGAASDWHLAQWTQYALARAGVVVIEATAVERAGRISHGCLGLYSDACEAAFARHLGGARRHAAPDTAWFVQLAHAGRKGSAQRPWEGGKALSAGEDAWQTFAPSAIAFNDGWPTPAALDEAGIQRVIESFVAAARRAVRVGVDGIELHIAHGYLMHEFFSALTNKRTDQWGGSLENRMRLPVAVARAVKAVLPANVALAARITGSDWVEGGVNPDDTVALAKALKGEGVSYLCVSSGALIATAQIPLGPGYQVPFAERVKRDTGVVTRAVGLIADPRQAEDIVASGKADCIAIARGWLDNPHWVWHAAERLGAKIAYPPQYIGAAPGIWPGTAIARPPAKV